MDQLQEERNVKNDLTDLTSTCQIEMPNKMQFDSIKEKNDCLFQSDINVKTEPPEESEFCVIAENSNGIYQDYDVRAAEYEPLIKMEHGDPFDDSMQDPLDVGGDINGRDEEQLLTKPCSTEKTEDKVQANNSVTRNNRIEYACGVCQKIFKGKCDYERHIFIHTGEKPFSCPICQKSYNRKSTLDNHMLIHSGEKPHECDICKKSFRYRADLNKHKLIHSGVKPYTCNICNKSFRQKPYYLQHLRLHTGARPYSCDLCGKTFTQKAHVIVHRRVHTGEKPYTCKICNRSFARISSIRDHKKRFNHLY